MTHKILVLLYVSQFIFSIQVDSTASSRKSSYISDDDDEEQSSDEENYQSEDSSDFESKNVTDSEDENETDETDEDEEPAHINCILFGDQGCQATCATLASLYSTSSKGACDASHICRCTLTSKPFITLWNDKFRKDETSKKSLEKFDKNSKIRKNVQQILLRFPRTTADSIEDLKEEYPDTKEYKNLKPNDKLNMPISKYINRRSQLDRIELLRKYLSTRLKQSIKKGDFTIDDVDFKANIKSFLDEDEPTLPTIINNKHFAKYLRKLFPKDMIEESAEDDLHVSDEIPDFVESVVVEEFVEYLKKQKKSKKKNDKKVKKLDSKNSKKSSNTLSFTDETKKYSTPQFKDFTSINDYQSLDKHWKTNAIDVRLIKNKNGSISLDWKKDNLGVTLNKQKDGSITQIWKVGNHTTIKLEICHNGSVKQNWKIADKTYQYTKSDNGMVKSSGNISKKDMTIYKYEIRAWCEENRKLFNFNDCIIYNKA